jgi:hypothetical protein
VASTLTTGHLGVTPLIMPGIHDLADLTSALASQRYEGSVHTPGWGSLEDDEGRLNRRLSNRPAGGEPRYVINPRRGPERVEARLYFDKYDSSLAKQADGEIQDEYLYVSDAVDLVFTNAEEGIAALASSTNYALLTRVVVPALSRLPLKDGPVDAFIGRYQGAIDGDLFLWLVARYNGDRQLTPQIHLYDLRALYAADTADRQTRLMRECIITRPTIQAAVTEPGCTVE